MLMLAVLPRVKIPLVTFSETSSWPPAASTSLMAIAFWLAAEKVNVPFSIKLCGPGALMTGAWFT